MPDNRFTIHFDLDSNANDFVLGWRHFVQYHRPAWLTRDLGDLLQRTRFDGPEAYDFWREWVTEDEFARLLSESAYELFLRLPAYPGFAEATKKAHEAGAKLVAVTDARVPFSGEPCLNQRRAKLEWVSKQCPWVDEVRFVHDPFERAHGADLVIDDKVANLQAADVLDLYVFAKEQPWNESWGNRYPWTDRPFGGRCFAFESWHELTPVIGRLVLDWKYGG